MKSRRRLLRGLGIAFALVLLFTLTGVFLAPVILKSQLEERLSAALGRHVTVEKVRVNPYAMTLTLENFAIREPDGTTLFVGWRRLFVNFEALASLRGEWVLGDIELDGFAARARLHADRSFNFSDILAKVAPPTNAAPTPKQERSRPIRIARLQVSEARVDIADDTRQQPFASVVGPLTFVLHQFRTGSERGAPYRFEAMTETGEKLAWSGTLQAEPFRSSGELALDGIMLPKYAPYYSDQIQADLAGGTVSLRGRYDLSLAPTERVLRLHEGTVQLRGLKLVERETGEPALELPEADVTGVEVDAVALKAIVGAVVLRSGRVRVRREKDGTINLLAMLRPPARADEAAAAADKALGTTQNAAAAAVAGSTHAPDLAVHEVVLKSFAIQVEDRAARRPAVLGLESVDVSLKNFTLAGGTPMPFQLALSWEPQGTLNVDGHVSFNPIEATLKTKTVGLALLPLSPYLEEFINARLTKGSASATLDTEVALPDGHAPSVTVSGNLALNEFGMVDNNLNEDLAGFGSVELRGLRASTVPELSVRVDELNIGAPYARVILDADKSLNLARLSAKLESNDGAATAPSTPTRTGSVTKRDASSGASIPHPLPKVEIGKVVIRDGDYRFTDRSVQPNVATSLQHFGGTIAGLSSINPTKAEVDLKGTVDGAGPIAIVGKLDLLGAKRSVDLKIDFANVDLLPLSPYSGKYAGYELARGKLLLDVKLHVDETRIDAANVITLNQFTFGNPVKSPDATGLPVRLGVALLKDMDGKIVIDVPVQGRTDDPEFRIGRVVLRVIVNLLTKAAVSPFSLIGAAFGGGGDELAFQDFAPGSTELQTAEQKKLETVTKALVNRPGLSLDLEGSYDAAADTYALKRRKLSDQVRRAIWEAKHQSDPNIPPPENLKVSAEEHVAMVKKLYDAKFPPGTEFGTPLPTPPPIITPPPAPSGLFRRLGYALTFRAKKEERLAQEENTRRAMEHATAVASAMAVGLPLDDMLGRLAEAVSVDENDLRELAQARARQVRDYFTAVGKIAPERLYLAGDNRPSTSPEPTLRGKGPRVFLHLQ